MAQDFTPDEIQALIQAGRLNDQTASKLNPRELAVYKQMSAPKPPAPLTAAPPDKTWLQSGAEVGNDLLTGAAKGAGGTVNDIGDVLRKIPGVSSLDSLMKPIPFNAEPSNATQSLGKGAERIGEFMLPIPGGAKLEATSSVLRMLPEFMHSGPGFNAVYHGVPAGLEGIKAYLTAALHKDPNPGVAGGIAAASGPVGQALAETAPLITAAAPYAGYGILGSASHALGQDNMLGLGGTLSLGSVLRHIIKEVMPEAETTAGVIRRGAPVVGQGIAGLEDYMNAPSQEKPK